MNETSQPPPPLPPLPLPPPSTPNTTAVVSSSPKATSSSTSTSINATSSTAPVCCEFFIDTLNRLYKETTNLANSQNHNEPSKSTKLDDDGGDDDDDQTVNEQEHQEDDEEDDNLKTKSNKVNSEISNEKEPVPFVSTGQSLLTPLDVISFLNYCHIWQQK